VSELALVGSEQLLDLRELEGQPLPPFSHLDHPVVADLNGLAPPLRRPQVAALEAIAQRATQVYTAESMPWHRLRPPHVLKIRSLLEENYRPASANRMLAALRGVLRECWHAGLISTDDSGPERTSVYLIIRCVSGSSTGTRSVHAGAERSDEFAGFVTSELVAKPRLHAQGDDEALGRRCDR
jgi:hypothetical protein